MNKDIRLSVSFFHHPKTIKLQSILGPEGILSLLRLWCYAGYRKPDGDLSNMTPEEIENHISLVVYPRGKFVKTLIDVKFLDPNLTLHNWSKHQPHLKLIATSKRLYTKAWQKIKRVVFKRDNYVCRYCGATKQQMECDHVIPISRGGNNSLSNLTTACPTCNRKKGNKISSRWNNG